MVTKTQARRQRRSRARARKRDAQPETTPGWFEDEESRWEAEGRRIALEGMDLPDGAFLAMADELGIDPY